MSASAHESNIKPVVPGTIDLTAEQRQSLGRALPLLVALRDNEQVPEARIPYDFSAFPGQYVTIKPYYSNMLHNDRRAPHAGVWGIEVKSAEQDAANGKPLLKSMISSWEDGTFAVGVIGSKKAEEQADGLQHTTRLLELFADTTTVDDIIEAAARQKAGVPSRFGRLARSIGGLLSRSAKPSR